jgi:hypothetical protein
MFDGAVGSCDVVGIWDGLCVGGRAMLRALMRITFGDGLNIGTLGSRVVGNLGRSTLVDGASVASGFVLWWRVGRRISCRFSMACVHAMEALVEVGTVPPRAVRVSVACSALRW